MPRNEAERLAALHGLHILDTPCEERFDRITRLATELFGVSTSFISLVDGERVWYKSSEGLGCESMPRSKTFCAHAILDPMRTLVVNDAARDERFHDNPCVTGPNGFRFYAGHPLLSPEGYALGTFCIMDRESHTLSDKQIEGLRDLAKMAEGELTTAELNHALGRLRKAEEGYRGIFENVAEGIFQISCGGGYMNANPAAARCYGFDSINEFMEQVQDFGRAQHVNPEVCDELMGQLKQSGRVMNFESEIYRRDGTTALDQ